MMRSYFRQQQWLKDTNIRYIVLFLYLLAPFLLALLAYQDLLIALLIFLALLYYNYPIIRASIGLRKNDSFRLSRISFNNKLMWTMAHHNPLLLMLVIYLIVSLLMFVTRPLLLVQFLMAIIGIGLYYRLNFSAARILTRGTKFCILAWHLLLVMRVSMLWLVMLHLIISGLSIYILNQQDYFVHLWPNRLLRENKLFERSNDLSSVRSALGRLYVRRIFNFLTLKRMLVGGAFLYFLVFLLPSRFYQEIPAVCLFLFILDCELLVDGLELSYYDHKKRFTYYRCQAGGRWHFFCCLNFIPIWLAYSGLLIFLLFIGYYNVLLLIFYLCALLIIMAMYGAYVLYIFFERGKWHYRLLQFTVMVFAWLCLIGGHWLE